METLRVAVIGGGFIGKQHMEAIRRIPGTQIVAISEMFEASAKKLAEEQAIPAWYTDYKEMLEKEKPDVVHICTPNNTHFQIANDVIEFGAYAYCEKPLGMNSKETEELARLVVEKGTKAGVNFNYRQNAMVREMHERIHGEINDPIGPVGKVYAVRGHYLQDWMMYDTDYNWRVVPALGGVSRTIADIGSHWFDTAQYVTGHKIVKVFCDMQTVIPQRKKPLKQVRTFETAAPEEYAKFYNKDFYQGYSYFNFYPFQLGYVLISEFIYSIFGTKSSMPMQVINVLSLATAYFALARITGLCLRERALNSSLSYFWRYASSRFCSVHLYTEIFSECPRQSGRACS